MKVLRRFWTVMFGGLTAIGLISGGIYTIVQYFDAKEKDRDVQERDRATMQLQVDATSLSAKQAFNTRHIEPVISRFGSCMSC